MASPILSYYADLIAFTLSWWYRYNKYKQHITSWMMRRQTSQSRTDGDSPYFPLHLLQPLSWLPMLAQHFPYMTTFRKEIRERATSCLDYLRPLITCFGSYPCYSFDLSSQLDKPKVSKRLGWIPFQVGCRGVYWKTRTTPWLSSSDVKIRYIPGFPGFVRTLETPFWHIIRPGFEPKSYKFGFIHATS